MISVHLEHRLNDYESWFETFKSAPVRAEIEREYGLKASRVLQNADDPNHCYVAIEAPDSETFKTFWGDARMLSALEERSTLFTTPPQVSGMYNPYDVEGPNGNSLGVLVEHHLNDFEAWFAIFKEGAARKPVQSELGMTAVRVLEDIDNNNRCIAAWSVPNVDAFDKFRDDPRSAAQLEKLSDHFIEMPKKIGTFHIHQL